MNITKLLTLKQLKRLNLHRLPNGQLAANNSEEYYCSEHEDGRLVDPYHTLNYTICQGEDLIAIDYRTLEVDGKKFVVIDSTLNCETGGFIMGWQYEEVEAEKALDVAQSIWDSAWDWFIENGLRRPSGKRDQKRFMGDLKNSLI